jgi:hypothetical protein
MLTESSLNMYRICVQVENAGISSVVVEARVPILRNTGSGFMRLQSGAFSKSHQEHLQLFLEGHGPIVVCAPDDNAWEVHRLDLHLLGSGNIHVHNVPADDLSVVLGGEFAVGAGNVYVTGHPSKHATVNLIGRGKVVVPTPSADVTLSGTGDVYVRGTHMFSELTGRITDTGVGNVYHTKGTCRIRETPYSKCMLSPSSPPQLVHCRDYPPSALDSPPREQEVGESNQPLSIDQKMTRKLIKSDQKSVKR